MTLSPCAQAQGESKAAKANTLYRQGVLAMKQGQVETARTCFEGVLALQPNNIHAKYQLKQLSLQSPRLAAKRREKQMEAVHLPKVEFEELTLPEALEAINAVVMKQTKGKFVPNFIVEDPKDVFQSRTFTLKLGSVPASVALKYALENARATARYDEHAIVVRPLSSGTPAPGGGDKPAKEPIPSKSVDPFAR